jgi:capsular polysaccharide export protein
MTASAAPPFLRIPPFPRHKSPELATTGTAMPVAGRDLAAALRRWRVGGRFWSPSEDPWTRCEGARRIVAHGSEEIALVAALCSVPLEITGPGRFAAVADPDRLEQVLEAELCGAWAYRDPFTGSPISPLEAIDLLGRWRRQIEANRSIGAVYGVARWKRITTDAMLWDGGGPVPHAGSAQACPQDAAALAWFSRTAPETVAALRRRRVAIGEIEDGMIRSTGLGANCVPPLSIVVDRRGPHFDPAQASDLETILQSAEIDADLLVRASALRERLVGEGIGKSGRDRHHARAAPANARRTVLVTGQVEDDRSVLCGGGGIGNLDLLRRARALEPDALLVFKPHPDVEAGHRKGRVPDAAALEFADIVDRSSSIAALLDRADAVHVITSLAGFEALMRGLEVVTHGVPFYAGWGLTRDLGQVPGRRTRRRTLDELVAATLIVYPRYLDPVTRLPCEAEILVDRIANEEAQVRSPLIRLRELQGRLNRLVQETIRP